MKKSLKRILSTVLAATMMTSSMVVSNIGAVTVSAASITGKSAGWKETAYTEWLPVTGASSYEAYVKKTSESNYTKLDDELVRAYSTFVRADAVGLAAGTYNMKIVAKDSSGNELASYESGAINVTNFTRDGFGFANGGSSSGAYNDDGTLKSNAKVFYVTDATKDTITMDVVTSSKGATTTCTGLGPIIKALEKGYETTPLDFRFIGQVTAPENREQALNQLDIKKAVAPITIEGIGNDAFALYDFNLVSANNIEIRNLGFKDMTTKDEDGVTIKDASQRVWVHNNDFFYGGHGSDKDQAKGDGSVDLKGTSTKITISENHYWDSGKVNLCGLGESADYEISYSRNWFDHSDSRHPRVRTGSIHIYNNYYDGVAKYGAGACTGSSLFVEGNYFRNTSKPVMSSNQGTDALGSGTFSGEAGGIIKMYDNIMVGSYTYIEANKGDGTLNQDSDGYTVANRSDTVPSTLKTVSGGTSYNNFDTLRDTGVTASGVLAAKDVPAYVTNNAGRMNGGNFKFIFNDSVDDASYDVNSELTAALAAYQYKSETSYVSSKSSTGVDGSTFYADRTTTYTTKTSALPTETDPTGNKATGGGSSTTYALELNGKTDVPTGSYTSNKTGLGTNGAFSILTTSAGSVSVSASKGIQLGGSANFETGVRLISVNVAEAGKIFATASSTSTDTRTLNVWDSTGNIIGTIATGSSDSVALPAAGTYYIGSSAKGINVAKIAVSYDSGNVESSTETTSKTVESSSQTTTKTVESSSQTTTKTVESSSETTTNAVNPSSGKIHNVSDAGTDSDFYNISATVSSSKGTVSYDGMTLEDCLKMSSSASVTFTNTKTGSLTLVFNAASAGMSVFLDGTSYTIPSDYVLEIENVTAGTHTLKKNSGESNLYYLAYYDNASVDPTPDPTPSQVKGDANGDGKVTRDDMTMVLDFASGKISAVTNAELADVSGDGKVTAYDAYLIGKIILG